MLLAIDVGTSQLHLGVFDGERLLRAWALPTGRGPRGERYLARTPELLTAGVSRPTSITGVAIASVVPSIRGAIVALCEHQIARRPAFVKDDLPSPIPVRYDPPEFAGADRIANAVAAARRHGAPAVVFDIGTATTIDVVAADGAFAGGMILPGFGLALQALQERAPHLPLPDPSQEPVPRPAALIGSSTGECLRSGFHFGAVAQVEGIIARLRGELGQNTPILATGGLSHLFSDRDDLFNEIDPNLTLHGIRMIWEASHSNR